MSFGYINLTSFMDAGPICAYESTPVSRLHAYFRRVGCSHVCIRDLTGRLLGVVTRRHLLREAPKRPLRRSSSVGDERPLRQVSELPVESALLAASPSLRSSGLPRTLSSASPGHSRHSAVGLSPTHGRCEHHRPPSVAELALQAALVKKPELVRLAPVVEALPSVTFVPRTPLALRAHNLAIPPCSFQPRGRSQCACEKSWRCRDLVSRRTSNLGTESSPANECGHRIRPSPLRRFSALFEERMVLGG